MSVNAVSDNDKNAIRELAKKYMDIAQMDIMAERKSLWRDLHDLKPKRPMILFETISLANYLADYQPQCEDEQLRNVEMKLISSIRQFEQMGDDIVLEPYFRMAWHQPGLRSTGMDFGDYKIEEHGATGTDSMAYLSNFPIKTPDDVKKLTPRQFSINREPSLKLKDKLQDVMGDILPVRLGNFDNFVFDIGNQPFTGNNFIGVTMDVFKLMGAEAMMLWPYDHPETLHELCRFLVDDKKRFYQFLLKEKLLDFNTDNQFAGPSMYGYVSELPDVDSDKPLVLKDLWAWAESQETQSMSPQMFDEFFLPYIAEIANMFGLSYYGCCEGISDRFEYIAKAIPNVRSVSVSGWADLAKAGELLGNKYVYSRKPTPALISTPSAQWDLAKKDAVETRNATKNGCVEIIIRDVYTKDVTPERAAKMVQLWKETFGFA
jgi:hypothetical protein